MTIKENQMKCPLCGCVLADEQFNLATKKLNEKFSKMHAEHMNQELNKYEKEKNELIGSYQSEIHLLETNRDSQLRSIKEELEKSYRVQLQSIQTNYNESLSQHSIQLQTLKNQLRSSFDEQLKNKDGTIKALEHEKREFQKKASDDAKSAVQQQVDKLQNEILQRDIQLLRFKDEVESLKKQVTQTQSELKGEAGELDLYAKLTEAFPEDQFRRQTRGKSGGDLIQTIRSKAGIIDTPIVYDNKQAESITPSDIVKAKKYQEIHGTRYVVIVSSKLPKRDIRNGLLGDRDGVYLVHPSILIPFSKFVRDAIIEISFLSKSDKERNSKEGILYQYIRSQEFTARMEQVARLQSRIWHLQDKEEKDHQKMWKDRRDYLTQSERQYSEIAIRIQSILSRQEDTRSNIVKKSPLEIENMPSNPILPSKRLET